MQSKVTRGSSQGNRPALATGQVRTNAVAAPPTIAPTTTAPSKDLLDVTKNDIGKRATQEELDKYLSCYVSSQIERVKYIAPENIIVRPATLFTGTPGFAVPDIKPMFGLQTDEECLTVTLHFRNRSVTSCMYARGLKNANNSLIENLSFSAPET